MTHSDIQCPTVSEVEVGWKRQEKTGKKKARTHRQRHTVTISFFNSLGTACGRFLGVSQFFLWSSFFSSSCVCPLILPFSVPAHYLLFSFSLFLSLSFSISLYLSLFCEPYLSVSLEFFVVFKIFHSADKLLIIGRFLHVFACLCLSAYVCLRFIVVSQPPSVFLSISRLLLFFFVLSSVIFFCHLSFTLVPLASFFVLCLSLSLYFSLSFFLSLSLSIRPLKLNLQ